jgi:hypothetical protein
VTRRPLHEEDAAFVRNLGCIVVGYVTVVLVAFFAAGFVAGMLASKASAADCEVGAFGCGHHELHDKYKEWQRPDVGGSCCNNMDCRAVRARPDGDGGWEIYLPEYRRWKAVPRKVTMKPDMFKDGRSHVCTGHPGSWSFEELPIYCFTPAEVKG